jgi:tRNA threonylcarbamoyladenosine biosynthesis protein TsaB
MKLLALDTSSVACSVAVDIDGARIERHEEQPREHTRLLMPMIRSALEEAGVSISDLDAIVLGNGPGSFIGMRIAASVAQGLAHGAALKIAPVSSLAAVAVRVFAESDATEVVVAQDARMNEVYLGIYERGDGGLPVPLIAERLQIVDAIPELVPAAADGRIAAGFGWQRYPQLLDSNRDQLAAEPRVLHPRAADLLPMGVELIRQGKTVLPQDVVPAYLRQKVAEKPSKYRNTTVI